MGRTESLNLKNDYERACGWSGHFNKSEMALFSECTERYAQNMLDTADIVREGIFRQLALRNVHLTRAPNRSFPLRESLFSQTSCGLSCFLLWPARDARSQANGPS